MKTYKLKIPGFTSDTITLKRTTYILSGTIAVVAIEVLSNGKLGRQDVLTTIPNINELGADNEKAFLDTTTFGKEILQWVLDNKVGKFNGEYGFSKYGKYPLVKFNINEIPEME